MAITTLDEGMGAAARRVAVVAKHLSPPDPAPEEPSSIFAWPWGGGGSMNDAYHSIHSNVPDHPVVWRTADNGSGLEFTDVVYEKAVGEGIAKITINRPDRRNAFRPKTLKELSRALSDARDDVSIGVIILTGKGLGGDATLLFYGTEEGNEGKTAYMQRRRPDFSKFPRLP